MDKQFGETAPKQQVPSVGRIVHYFDYKEDGTGDTEPQAAIITQVETPGEPNSRLGLAVFYVERVEFMTGILKCETPKQVWRWDWPEYVPAK